MRRILPNDACPCGSGLKYKKCCGGIRRLNGDEIFILLLNRWIL